MSDFYTDPYHDGADEGVRFFQDRTVGDVISDALHLLRENARPLALGLGAIGGPFVLAGLGLLAWALSLSDAGTEPIGVYILLFVVFIVGYFYVHAALFGFLLAAYRQDASAITLAVLWAETRRVFWPIFGLLFLTGFLSGLVELLDFLPVAGPFLNLAASLVLAPVLGLAFGARLFDENTAFSAVERAFTLARRRPGLVLGGGLLVLFVALLLAVAAIGLPVVAAGFFSGAGVFGMAAPSPTTIVLFVAYALVIVLGTMAFYYTACVLLYGTAVERTEGTTLQARVDALDGDEASAAPTAW